MVEEYTCVHRLYNYVISTVYSENYTFLYGGLDSVVEDRSIHV